MARPKAKHKRVTVGVTLDERVLKAARYDIDNLSAFFEVCLKRHILKILQSPERDKLLDECGDDILYIMRSCQPVKSLSSSDEPSGTCPTPVDNSDIYDWLDADDKRQKSLIGKF